LLERVLQLVLKYSTSWFALLTAIK